MPFYVIIYNNLKGEFIMFSYKQKRSLALLDAVITILSFVCLIVTIMIILVVNEKASQYVFFIQSIILFGLFINSLIKVNNYINSRKKSVYKYTSKQPIYISKYMNNNLIRF